MDELPAPQAIGAAYVAGLCSFVVIFIAALISSRRSVTEIPQLRFLIRALRGLLLAYIALLAPLLTLAARWDAMPIPRPITAYRDGSGSWNYGWGRPMTGMASAFMGMFMDYHPGVRCICMGGLSVGLVLDTISAIDLDTQRYCVAEGRCPMAKGYTAQLLQWLYFREMAACAIGTCALAHILYLSAVTGVFRTRYTYRQLHTGQHNRAAALRKELQRTKHLYSQSRGV
ncbi:hypothetical protein JKP88DRAFT_287501 [Tribonema minus]|uniref:Uncharacterized protein n=1 Tax=Tribonema minus TaxID=303371 RepID=A0A835Z6W0_9STRA|nr:hypothetical protein JKP88DRAFT_287501 [Tribonema minus]